MYSKPGKHLFMVLVCVQNSNEFRKKSVFMTVSLRIPNDTPRTQGFFIGRAKTLIKLNRCHYANMPMQNTAISHGCKNVNFQMKYCDIFSSPEPKAHR